MTVSTEALPMLAGVLPVDLEVQRRAAMYYSRQRNMEHVFLGARDRGKITRSLRQQSNVYNDLIDEWQQRWDESSKVPPSLPVLSICSRKIVEDMA
ncbi:unnamed protein product [Arctia plantaginis]|uniref:Uncharacterized protein n=1 Tax=Arctia plantaginis TaxID=874455 RepID=A0A8S0Z8F5_ARCPL|nr:unnamed protein product [Arctia plantaginis]